MLKINFLVTWRNMLRSKAFTVINLLGLGMGFAGFLLSALYINRETGFDKQNPELENIYLIGITHQGASTDLTPPALARAVAANIPEVKKVGRISYSPFETPFISSSGSIHVKNWKGADRSIAEIFNIEVPGLDLTNPNLTETNLITEDLARILFPDSRHDPAQFPQQIALDQNHTFIYNIHGIAPDNKHSNLNYEAIFFKNDLADHQETGNPVPFQTYILLHPGQDAARVEQKINSIYHQHISPEHHTVTSGFAKGDIYLDPLKNLHLQPRHGSNTGYLTVWALRLLSGLILLMAGINFANLMVAQANKRIREMSIRKLMGLSSLQLGIQLMLETLLLCVMAGVLSMAFIVAGKPVLQQWVFPDPSYFVIDHHLSVQLGIAVIITALIAGVYPAVMLSRFKPANTLKSTYRTQSGTYLIRNGLLTFQVVLAMIFISGFIIMREQLRFMSESEKGFDPSQVIHVKNMGIYDTPKAFQPVRNQLAAYDGVTHATVATHTPGSLETLQKNFTFIDQEYSMAHVGVDFDYFETLGIDLLEGRTFQAPFSADPVKTAVINETAARKLGVGSPIGKTIRGCDTEFIIAGVVKDSKMQGFEKLIKPTVYTIENTCGQFKCEILLKIAPGTTRKTLDALEKNWATINKIDGFLFNYEFIDQKYAQLNRQHELLQTAFTGFTMLAIGIAIMGLLSMTIHAVSLREKELSIRKIMGAGPVRLFLLLNRPFIRIVILAVVIASPIAWWVMNQWLQDFAYRIEIQWWMFAVAGLLAIGIALATVSSYAVKAALANPADSLRNE